MGGSMYVWIDRWMVGLIDGSFDGQMYG